MKILAELLLRLEKYQGTIGGRKILDTPISELPPFLLDDIYPLLDNTYYYLNGIKEVKNGKKT